MNSPTIAFVLCAGRGERLRPMTLGTPKPLMPIWNRPLLAHTLEQLASWGVKDVYLNTHWLPEALQAFIANYNGSLTLHELQEPTLLGTGGALRNLAPHLQQSAFWMINGDIAFDLNPEPLKEGFVQSGNFAATWVDAKRGPRTVEMDYAGRITNYASPTAGVEHTYTFCGVSLLSPNVLHYLPKEKAICSLIDAFNAALFDGHCVQGVCPTAETYWNDAGTLARYLQVHRDAQKLPSLARYRTDATTVPSQGVADALAALKWKIADTILIPLGTRGSQRTFWRLVSPRRSVIAILYETQGRTENGAYAAAAKSLLKAAVPVPKVLIDLPQKQLLILEDLGDNTLDTLPVEMNPCTCEHAHDAVSAHDHPRLPALAKTMELLAKFHGATVNVPLEPPFDATLMTWEHHLYEQYVAPFPEAARTELATLQRVLLNEPSVLMHRDFQSSNILVSKGLPFVIDFQGMRRGPALYDLASFLYDPYVTWAQELQEEAITAYAHASGRDEATLREVLPFAGVQRLIQAIGAYHRLASVGQTRFLAYVPIARKRAVALAQLAQLPNLAQALA
ncbi:MAG: phosphotransferase [Kiritimatiellia bacterium]